MSRGGLRIQNLAKKDAGGNNGTLSPSIIETAKKLEFSMFWKTMRFVNVARAVREKGGRKYEKVGNMRGGTHAAEPLYGLKER